MRHRHRMLLTLVAAILSLGMALPQVVTPPRS